MSAGPIHAFEEVPFTQVDAFSSIPFGGNPAAVLELKEFPPDEVLTVSLVLECSALWSAVGCP